MPDPLFHPSSGRITQENQSSKNSARVTTQSSTHLIDNSTRIFSSPLGGLGVRGAARVEFAVLRSHKVVTWVFSGGSETHVYLPVA